jgi:hypothetical protein
VNGKNKIFIQTDVKKTDFILKIKKIFFYNDFTHPNSAQYPNNLGVPPARKKGYSLCRQGPFSCLLSGHPRYFGSLLLSFTRAHGRNKKKGKHKFASLYINIFQ